ncbi:MAG: fibrobacter succinogenes major paralogous domain-containing protein [Dysgonamonadaceae bacterium]|jgi:uncharacterized protein (TIGR02145 family)|nr:fibrobacter succinogenes major paralogous domain-containing protein [Dysgonamonadaceae bacterium]
MNGKFFHSSQNYLGASYLASGASYFAPAATYLASGASYFALGASYLAWGASYLAEGASYLAEGATYFTMLIINVFYFINNYNIELNIINLFRTMKQILLTMTAFFMLNAAGAQAQVTIGSLDNPQSFSILELVSTDRGLRLPQMTTSQRETMQETPEFTAKATTEAMGLQIFNTTNGCVETWNGAEWIQTCIQTSTCPPSITDGQNTYSVGDFGAAGCWMTENLRTKTKSYTGGMADLSSGASSSTTVPYYSYPTEGSFNTPTSEKFDANPEYGLLYNWAAASGRTGAGEDSEGVELTPAAQKPTGAGDICPDGWHLPSDYEWNMLEKEIANASLTTNKYGIENTLLAWEDGFASNGYFIRGDYGTVMKSQTPVSGVGSTDGKSNTRDNNGFDALIVGNVDGSSAIDYGSQAGFWSSSSSGVNNAWFRLVGSSSSEVGRIEGSKNTQYSVRCKKNE